MAFALRSSAFNNGQPIPKAHTGFGEDRSPPLTWSDAPSGTKSFALVVDDPDAPSARFVHWVVYNIPAARSDLPADMQHLGDRSEGTMQGSNGWQRIGWNGPKPPDRSAHRYFFKLYALDTELNLEPGATKAALFDAMEGHVLALAELIGTFEKPS